MARIHTHPQLHPQLKELIDEFENAQDRLHGLAERAPQDFWSQRPDPTRWSMAECVAHLSLTSEAYLPIVTDALERSRTLGVKAPSRYRRDPTGWLLWKMSGPPVRFRVKTTARFIPSAAGSPYELVAHFDRLQAELIALVRAANNLPIQKIRIVSPFDARFKYNLYSCLTILPRHQHRHLWQAEQVLRRGAV